MSCYVKRVSIFLIMAALIAGMAGCGGYTPSEDLEIRTWYDLDDVRDNLGGSYILMNDLDSTTSGYEKLASPTANQGKGWQPIAGFVPSYGFTVFGGTFDGQGYEIRDLYINRTDTDENPVGLFCAVDEGGLIENIGMTNATVNGFLSIGSLVGENGGTVSNCYATGNISGRAWVGGLVGLNTGIVAVCYSSSSVTGRINVGGLVGGLAITSISLGTVSGSYATGGVSGLTAVGGLVGQNGGTVSNCYATGNITGDEDIGGLVGRNHWQGDWVSVSNSHSTGNVNGDAHIGGLVGRNYYCTVVNSHSISSVSGNSSVGGLVGWNDGAVSNCYATGDVIGDQRIGGLAGDNTFGTVSDSYSTGDVTGDECVGGLIGKTIYSTVSNSYSTGSVTGNASVGGLLGWWNPDYCTVTNSFWDTQTSGQSTSAGGNGKTTAEMQDIATFTDTETEGLDEPWDIIAVADLGTRNLSYIWNIVDGLTYPFLSWQP